MILDQYALGSVSKRIRKVFSVTFRRMEETEIRTHLSKSVVKDEVGIYIHFPFCKSLCPACPYVREIATEKRINDYLSALRAEIEMVGKMLKDTPLKVVDIHVGGGTPSLLGREWKKILDVVEENFDVSPGYRFGVEANPDDLTEDRTFSLRESANEISVGVQSFYKQNLKMLGRRHDVESSLEALENCRRAGFELVNIDMMYLLPKQKISGWVSDLKLATEQGADQITCYPLLAPSYTSIHDLMIEGKIPQQPDIGEFKRMYYAAVDTLKTEGYVPIRYYSFSKKGREYSTVEREMVGPLLGFGSGAMGNTGSFEYVNTCSVKEYIRAIRSGKVPIAGGREVSKEERAVRWVAERLSALKLKIDDFEKEFDEPFDALMKRSGYSTALRMGLLFKNLRKKNGGIEVTEKGMWQRNLSGWAFVLSVPCRIVEEFTNTPWPLEVEIP